jgi:hypothetical protein
MSLKVHIRKARKVLVASIGVATVSFVGVGCGGTSVANLQAPPSCDVAPTSPYCVGGQVDAGGGDSGDLGDGGGDGGDSQSG